LSLQRIALLEAFIIGITICVSDLVYFIKHRLKYDNALPKAYGIHAGESPLISLLRKEKKGSMALGQVRRGRFVWMGGLGYKGI